MQIPTDKTGKMLLVKTEEELFNSIIDSRHPFRRLKEIINFETLVLPMRAVYHKHFIFSDFFNLDMLGPFFSWKKVGNQKLVKNFLAYAIYSADSLNYSHRIPRNIIIDHYASAI